MSSPPLAARTRAQARAARVDQASSAVASRPAMSTTHVASSGPRGLPPVVNDWPAHVANSPPGSGEEESGTSSVAGSLASSPICRSPPIIVSSADDIPQPIPSPPLMPPALTTVASKPCTGRPGGVSGYPRACRRRRRYYKIQPKSQDYLLKIQYFCNFSLVSLSIHPRSRRDAQRIRKGKGRWSRAPKTFTR